MTRRICGDGEEPTPVDVNGLPDQQNVRPERLRRVQKSQARTDTRGRRRPPRDPEERAFLEERGLLGPYEEAPTLPPVRVVRKRKPD